MELAYILWTAALGRCHRGSVAQAIVLRGLRFRFTKKANGRRQTTIACATCPSRPGVITRFGSNRQIATTAPNHELMEQSVVGDARGMISDLVRSPELLADLAERRLQIVVFRVEI